MSYSWPVPNPDPVLDEAVDVALGYLEATGQANVRDNDTLSLVQSAMLNLWFAGARHKIRLANEGIVAVQQAKTSPQNVERCVVTPVLPQGFRRWDTTP
jgi:hypothetical protein